MISDASGGSAGRRRRGLHRLWDFLLASFEHWRDMRTLRLGAGLAYYSLFAVVPLLSLAVAIVARLVPNEEAKQWLNDALDDLVGTGVEEISEQLTEQVSGAATGLGLLGFILVLISASFLFAALQDALNVIWAAPVKVGLRNNLRRRLLAVGLALAVAAYFISSLVIHAVVGLAERLVPGEIPVIEALSELLSSAALWAVGVLTIALLFHALPYATVRWRDSIVGAALTAVFVTIGTWLVGAYLARFGSTSITGAAGSVVLFLALVYYQAQILLAGAVVTRMLGDRARERFEGDPR